MLIRAFYNTSRIQKHSLRIPSSNLKIVKQIPVVHNKMCCQALFRPTVIHLSKNTRHLGYLKGSWPDLPWLGQSIGPLQGLHDFADT